MADFGRILLRVGIVLALIGGLLLLSSRWNWPIGRLPGDISYRGRNVSVFAPLGTSLLISVVISLVLYLLSRFRR